MLTEIERFFNEGLNANRYMGVPKMLSMKTDIKNYQDKYEVICEVPGLKKEDIHVSMESDVLVISATYAHKEEEAEFGYLLRERVEGEITRKFKLPYVDVSKISASLDAGILTLTLPKMAERAKRTIEIE